MKCAHEMGKDVIIFFWLPSAFQSDATNAEN